ncbi:MAG: calcium/sodium antiporter, partial [Myxococcota bacterium]
MAQGLWLVRGRHRLHPSSESPPLSLFLASLAVLAGFFMLVWGADRFVYGAAGCARSFGIPPLIIGLTIVGFGTSAPELLVSSLAALEGEPGMGVGNALGSNITNVALVLGIATLVRPLAVQRNIVVVDIPVLLAVMTGAFLLLIDGELGRVDGALLLGGLTLMIAIIVRQGLRGKAPTDALDDVPDKMDGKTAVFWLVVGLAVLLGGAKLLVDNAVAIATSLGVDSTVIGLTVVAFGTSLPELAAT